MRLKDRFGKDHYGALLLTLMGSGIVLEGLRYRMGTLTQMGAGFIPVVLGTLMVMVGLVIGLTAAKPAPESDKKHAPEWRGWGCILAGVLAFVLFGHFGGLVPATFAAVFISAMGDKQNTVRDAALLALVMVIAGTLIFHWGLRMQLPLFTWGG